MKYFGFLYLIAAGLVGFTQGLKPGFDRNEYIEQMLISVQSVKDSSYASEFDRPKSFEMIYQSENIGLDNSWDLWLNSENIASISLRGTTEKPESWLENFYAAMIPAKGTIIIEGNKEFEYDLSADPKAAVHVGWAVGLAYLIRDIQPKIDSLYEKGTKDFLITGHSQGGAIAYLLTAHLRRQQLLGNLPSDLKFKTYCSAAPKPGNLYFAYTYEAMTQNGWGFNVVNSADWVPEVPMSIQTLNDFNIVNPFVNVDQIIKKQKLPARVVMKRIYKKLDKPTKKAQKNYEKYLGKMANKLVANKLEGLSVPDYVESNNYVRTGITIVLTPDQNYYDKFPNNPEAIFSHHFHHPYLYLAKRLGKAFYE